MNMSYSVIDNNDVTIILYHETLVKNIIKLRNTGNMQPSLHCLKDDFITIHQIQL
jgi:hypothetical protein